jgi:hypothetical protein
MSTATTSLPVSPIRTRKHRPSSSPAAGARLRVLFDAECERRGLPHADGALQALSGPDLQAKELCRQEMAVIRQQASLLNPPA